MTSLEDRLVIAKLPLWPRFSLRTLILLTTLTAFIAWMTEAGLNESSGVEEDGLWAIAIRVCIPLDVLWLIWFFAYAWRVVGMDSWRLSLIAGGLCVAPYVFFFVVGFEGTRPFLDRLLCKEGLGALLLLSSLFVRPSAFTLSILLLFQRRWLGAVVNSVHGAGWLLVIAKSFR